jgi:hypothetical protein
VLPAPYSYGNAGAYIVQADGRRSVDIAIHKIFNVRERQTFDLRAEFFNLPNTVSFGNPNNSFNSNAFGTITSTGVSARQIQIALRYAF